MSETSSPQLFSVDADGNGAGRIVSETGDVYEGSFVTWMRHGWGVQRWASGELFRGIWEKDAQANGVFTDVHGVRWKGNFLTGQIERIEEQAGAGGGGADDAETDEMLEQELQQQHADDVNEHKENSADDGTITHFPPSSSGAYQAQYDPYSQTQPLNSPSAGAHSATVALPPPHSARSANGRDRRNGAGGGGARSISGSRTARVIQWTPQRVQFTRKRESKAEREAREAREKQEEELVLKELSKATPLLSNRFGSPRMPQEATFGLENFAPGPGAYSPSHDTNSRKRNAPRISMAPKLPYQSEVALNVKCSVSREGPAAAHVHQTAENPTKPRTVAVKMTQPTLLPIYVKESNFFKPDVPGPGAYSPLVSPTGKGVTIANNNARVAAHGGQAIKGHPIPMFLGHAYMRSANMGQGADGGLYNPNYQALATKSKSPSFSMPGRGRSSKYHELKLAAGPSPASYTPSLKQVDPSPIERVSGWGKSRSGNRPTPVESIRAVAYAGEKMMRNQMGLHTPGPAAYNLPTSFQPVTTHTHPSKTITANFNPHIIQPPSVHLVKHFLHASNRDHPFVQEFIKQQKAARGESLEEGEETAADEIGDGATESAES